MALLSLVFLLIAIILGFFRKMNTGLVSIAFALVLGRLAGVSDAVIIKGFNSSLFMMLLGVTYLFSLAQLNGTLELLAHKVVALAGKRIYLIPVIIYGFSTILSALGPGTVPTMAIMMVFAMALAAELGITLVLLSALIVLGASGGGVSPLAATGIIGIKLCADFGLHDIGQQFLLNGVLSSTVYAVIIYFALGGYKLESHLTMTTNAHISFDKKQLITLAGIGVMVLLVLLFKFNVGLVSFAVAAVLSFLRVSDESKALKQVPWGTLLLILGIILVIRGVRAMKAEKAAGNVPEKKTAAQMVKDFWSANRAVIEMFVVLLIYIALIQPVGFLISTFLFLFAEFNILSYKEDRKIGFTLIFALICAVAIYALFKYAFSMPLPQGILKGIF